jgi:transposase
MSKHKFAKTNLQIISDAKNKVLACKDHLWAPNLNSPLTTINPHNWFSFKRLVNDSDNLDHSNLKNFEQTFNEKCYKSINVDLVVNDQQQFIFENWFDATTKLYNIIANYFNIKFKLVKLHTDKINFCLIEYNRFDFIYKNLTNNCLMAIKFVNKLLARYKFDFLSNKRDSLNSYLLDLKSLNSKVQSNRYHFEMFVKNIKENCASDCQDFNLEYFNNIKLKDIDESCFDSIKNYNTSDTYMKFKYVNIITPIFLEFKLDAIKDLQKNIILECANLTEWYKNFTKREATFKYEHIDQKEYNKINYHNLVRIPIDHNFIRTRKLFKRERDNIKNNSFPIENVYNLKDKTIYTHILDQTIAMACSNYDSIMTKYIKGTLNKFKLRKIKDNKNNKIMRIEQSMLKNGTILENIFGKLSIKCNGQVCKEFDIIDSPRRTSTGKIKCTCLNTITDLSFLERNKSDVLVRYDKKSNVYKLLISKKIIPDLKQGRNKIVTIDPGIRTFLTCLSEKELVEVCDMTDKKNEVKDQATIAKYNKLGRLVDKLRKVKKIQNDKRRKKKERQYEKRIKYQIDELHWKTINYLTKNFDTIIIGNMSTQRIVSREKSNLTDFQKDYLYRLSLCKFKERLKYKCDVNKVNYLCTDESYTSIMCSKCGTIKWDLGRSKIYSCENCGIVMDRDVNGCRNIYAKS